MNHAIEAEGSSAFDISFGFTIRSHFGSIVTLSKRLETLGFEAIAFPERIMLGSPPVETSSAIPLLGVAAGATVKPRLVAAVLQLPFHHPTMLGKMTSMLDVASAGRLTVGVGVGGESVPEFRAMQVPVSERGRRTDEALELLKRLWTEEAGEFHGQFYDVTKVTLNPRPAQSPHPPIWVGGRTPAAMKRAARYGNGWIPYLYSPEQYRLSISRISERANSFGRDTFNFEWALVIPVTIADTMDEATAIAAKRMQASYKSSKDLSELACKYCLLGPVDACAERLLDYADAGVRWVIFQASVEDAGVEELVERLGKEVIPRFRNKWKSRVRHGSPST